MDDLLPQNRADTEKYVEVNVYVDPAVQDQVTINADNTFTLKNGADLAPVIFNKTTADGHTELNVHFGDYASSIHSKQILSSGRIETGGEFKLTEQKNISTISEAQKMPNESLESKEKKEKLIEKFSGNLE